MLRKCTLLLIVLTFLLTIFGCKTKNHEITENKAILNRNHTITTFDENYRPAWWENLQEDDHLYSYAYVDGSNQNEIKIKALTIAQSKMLRLKKNYVVNLTSLIMEESNSQERFKSNTIIARDKLVYNRDYSDKYKVEQTDFITKSDTEFRCFLAISLPTTIINKSYVEYYQKHNTISSAFAQSETYLYLLKIAGLEPTSAVKQPTTEKVKSEMTPPTPSENYEQDFIPAWFKISHNTNKVMVNQTAIATSIDQAEQAAYNLCNSRKMTYANNFARSQAEKYRADSGYDEIEFNQVKNQISQEVLKNKYPINKEFVKTLHIGKDQYKTYAQYSIDKKLIEKAIALVIKNDDVLYSRLRASMAFDELDDFDF